MNIRKITSDKKAHLELLLADERESMIDNYDHPMFGDGVQLVDMVYLKREG